MLNFANFNIILFERFSEIFMLLPFIVFPYIIPCIFLFRDIRRAKNDAPRQTPTLKSMGLIGLHAYIELNRSFGSDVNSLLIITPEFYRIILRYFTNVCSLKIIICARLLKEKKWHIFYFTRSERHAVMIKCPLKQ